MTKKQLEKRLRGLIDKPPPVLEADSKLPLMEHVLAELELRISSVVTDFSILKGEYAELVEGEVDDDACG